MPSLRSDSTNGMQVKTKPNYIVKMKKTNLIRTVYSVVIVYSVLIMTANSDLFNYDDRP